MDPSNLPQAQGPTSEQRKSQLPDSWVRLTVPSGQSSGLAQFILSLYVNLPYPKSHPGSCLGMGFTWINRVRGIAFPCHRRCQPQTAVPGLACCCGRDQFPPLAELRSQVREAVVIEDESIYR